MIKRLYRRHQTSKPDKCAKYIKNNKHKHKMSGLPENWQQQLDRVRVRFEDGTVLPPRGDQLTELRKLSNGESIDGNWLAVDDNNKPMCFMNRDGTLCTLLSANMLTVRCTFLDGKQTEHEVPAQILVSQFSQEVNRDIGGSVAFVAIRH